MTMLINDCFRWLNSSVLLAHSISNSRENKVFPKLLLRGSFLEMQHSDTVADYSHRKETTLSSCQLKCVLRKQKFNFNAVSYSILMALMIFPLIHKSLNYLLGDTVPQAVQDSRNITVCWRNPLRFMISQITNQAVLGINKSFLQSPTSCIFVWMLPLINTHLPLAATDLQGRF